METESISLIKKLISIPSLSKQEDLVANFLFEYLTNKGYSVNRLKNNIYFSIGNGDKTLLLNSHIDTVPAGKSWKNILPYEPQNKDGKIYGLGSTDAYASIVSMLEAIGNINVNSINGRIVFAATAEEEVSGNNGAELLFTKWNENISAAIIGEPTSGSICTSMKGLTYINLQVKGKSSHASIPSEGENAIIKASEIINKISNIPLPKHPTLGTPTISVTMIKGGTKNNIIPDACDITIDIRTTPLHDREYFLNQIKKIISSKSNYKNTIIQKKHERLISKHTENQSDIVTATLKATNNKQIKPFTAMCDATFLNCPFVIFGPGRLEMAHAPDEYIEISELEKFSNYYQKIIQDFLK